MSTLRVETFRLGVRNLLLHKLRSLLTVLGIIFGVAAVICMLSISEGASADELRLLALMGTQNIIVNAVRPQQATQASEGNTNLLEYGITFDDLDLIASTIPHVQRIVPLKKVSESVRRMDRRMTTSVLGTQPEFFDTVHIDVSSGRRLTAVDVAERKNVCVIGDEVRRELFSFSDPIGESILVEYYPTAVPFTVVGVLQRIQTAGTPERGVEERDLNREILIPLSTARSQFGDLLVRRSAGSREMTRIQVTNVYVTADSLETVLPVSDMVKRVFARNHQQLDYDIKVPLARLKLAEQKKRNNQLLLGFIAGISLLVGGIGIMNIMLATVTERTREIGIRRALGAKRRDITTQFLVETVVLSTGGGVIGVGLGWAGAQMVNRLADWETIVQPWAVLVSFGLSVFVGIFFGMYPAMSAARLDPIEALRFE
ncbi:MAG: FtsX-like permease family protein [Phycisphaerales bacterium]|nr:MAG: FtsX-like permease family protein [Phycisphaerales bacterium]